MSFDSDCYDLARHFLDGMGCNLAQVEALAQALQDCAEDFIGTFEGDYDACTCRARPARSTDLSPPEPTRNPRCPTHGDLRHVDPDRARDQEMDRAYIDPYFDVTNGGE